MEPWQVEFASDAANVILGWALGMSSAVGIDAWRSRSDVKTMKAGIRIEFAEIAYRLVTLVHKQAERDGSFGRDTLVWVRDQAMRYEGPNPRDGILKGTEGLLKQDDAALAAMAAVLKARSTAQVIPSEQAPFAESMMGKLNAAGADYSRRVLDVLAHLRMYNEAVASGEYYLRLTFTPNLTEANHQGAVRNLEAACEQAARRARIIVNKIGSLDSGA